VVLGDQAGPGGRPGSPADGGPGRLHHLPGEVFAAPRSWVEAVYPGLAYFNEVEKGGHVAAWEKPQLFSTEVRLAFSSLRE
jgi:hypothetical protein